MKGSSSKRKRRLRRDRARDLYAPALTAREAVAARIDEIQEAEFVEQQREATILLGARYAVLFPDQANVFADGKLAKDRVFLCKIADAGTCTRVHRFRADVDLRAAAYERDRTAIGLDQTDDHVEGRGFTGAVGSQQSDDFTLVHVRGHTVDDRTFAVVLAQIAQVDRFFNHPRGSRRRAPDEAAHRRR